MIFRGPFLCSLDLILCRFKYFPDLSAMNLPLRTLYLTDTPLFDVIKLNGFPALPEQVSACQDALSSKKPWEQYKTFHMWSGQGSASLWMDSENLNAELPCL